MGFLCYAATALLLTIITEHAWAAVLGVSLFLGWALLVDGSPSMIAFGILNVLLIAWTHRRDLAWPPHARCWLSQLFGRLPRLLFGP